MAEASWTFEFTDGELNAIYTAIENTPSNADLEAAYESVLEKITPDAVGSPPAGASSPRFSATNEGEDR